MLIMLLISGCNASTDENKMTNHSNQDIEDSMNEMKDIDIGDNGTEGNVKIEDEKNEKYNIKDVFPQNIGFVWYYEGPNDTEKVSVIDNVIQSEESVV
jgi:hypothetical protein